MLAYRHAHAPALKSQWIVRKYMNHGGAELPNSDEKIITKEILLKLNCFACETSCDLLMQWSAKKPCGLLSTLVKEIPFRQNAKPSPFISLCQISNYDQSGREFERPLQGGGLQGLEEFKNCGFCLPSFALIWPIGLASFLLMIFSLLVATFACHHSGLFGLLGWRLSFSCFSLFSLLIMAYCIRA